MIHTDKIDTDPDANLVLLLTNMLNGLPQQRQRLLSVTAVQFTEFTRGYIVITDDTPEPPK